MAMTVSMLMLAPAVQEKPLYDPIRDLTPVARIGTSPIVMLAASDAPANNLADFISAAKGATESIQYGTWGAGSTGHFCAEVVKQKTGARVTHVPYNGTAPVMRALLSGEIKYGFLDAATGTAAVQTGKIKPIAMCTRRMATFPNVATYKEQGVDFDQWTGWTVVAPAGLPRSVADKYDAAFRSVIQDPAVSAKLAQWGITPDFVSGAEQALVHKREFEIWKKVAKDASIKP
jgi:tripartite-type tricarboxylate transporter receptor subunit TctC